MEKDWESWGKKNDRNQRLVREPLPAQKPRNPTIAPKTRSAKKYLVKIWSYIKDNKVIPFIVGSVIVAFIKKILKL